MPLHPFVVGQPHRIDALHDVLRHVTAHDRVWLATAAEIADDPRISSPHQWPGADA